MSKDLNPTPSKYASRLQLLQDAFTAESQEWNEKMQPSQWAPPQMPQEGSLLRWLKEKARTEELRALNLQPTYSDALPSSWSSGVDTRLTLGRIETSYPANASGNVKAGDKNVEEVNNSLLGGPAAGLQLSNTITGQSYQDATGIQSKVQLAKTGTGGGVQVDVGHPVNAGVTSKTIAALAQARADELTGSYNVGLSTGGLQAQPIATPTESVSNVAGSSSGCKPKDIKDTTFSELGDRVIALEATDQEFKEVERLFVSGFVGSLWPQVTAIHRVQNNRAKVAHFQEHYEMVRTSRGEANLKRAWHGSSVESIVSIIRYGFAQMTKPVNGNAFGSGTYLAPCDKPYISAGYAKPDKKKQHHVLLCEVILGESEAIPRKRTSESSTRCTPTSTKYDSAVDDVNDPNLYLVWSPFINSHVAALYIVSYAQRNSTSIKCNTVQSLQTAPSSSSGIATTSNDPSAIVPSVQNPTVSSLPPAPKRKHRGHSQPTQIPVTVQQRDAGATDSSTTQVVPRYQPIQQQGAARSGGYKNQTQQQQGARCPSTQVMPPMLQQQGATDMTRSATQGTALYQPLQDGNNLSTPLMQQPRATNSRSASQALHPSRSFLQQGVVTRSSLSAQPFQQQGAKHSSRVAFQPAGLQGQSQKFTDISDHLSSFPP